MKKIPGDVVGNIAILKFPRKMHWIFKKYYAIKYLHKNKNIKTVLEKIIGFSGRLRKQRTKFIAGEKTKQAIYKENGCTFKFNVDEVYFSPRLSTQRKKISEEILRLNKPFPKILVMFAGISPFPIVIAKTFKKAKKRAEIWANELNRKANEMALQNIKQNKVEDFIKLIPGDAKKIPEKIKEKFDVIIMPRPNLKETFLDTALKLAKKDCIIYYYGFGSKEKVLKEIKTTIKNPHELKIEKAGDIGPGEFRWLVKFKI